MLAETLHTIMATETRQATGRNGRLWHVTINPNNNGMVTVKVAGDMMADLLRRIWYNQIVGKKMAPSAPELFPTQLDLLEGIITVVPVPRQYILKDKRWTRYVVRVYCCNELVEVVAVKNQDGEDRQMKYMLYRNEGGHLPITPSDSVSWDNFHPVIVSEEPTVETKMSVRLLPLPKPEPLTFEGIHCPICGCHNETSKRRCKNCNNFLREDTRSTHRLLVG